MNFHFNIFQFVLVCILNDKKNKNKDWKMVHTYQHRGIGLLYMLVLQVVQVLVARWGLVLQINKEYIIPHIWNLHSYIKKKPLMNCELGWEVTSMYSLTKCTLEYNCCQVNLLTFICDEPLIEMIITQSLWHIIIWNRCMILGLNQQPVVTTVH